jgi:hypothetical protein
VPFSDFRRNPDPAQGLARHTPNVLILVFQQSHQSRDDFTSSKTNPTQRLDQ